jgi:hypothetical protein
MVIIRCFKSIKNVVNIRHWTAYDSVFIVISPRLIQQQIILN